MGEGLTGPCSDCHCILNQLSEDAKKSVDVACYPQNSLICSQGQRIEKVLVLCAGKAKLTRSRQGFGKKLEVSLAQPGSVLGYQEWLEGCCCWRTSAKAVEDCQVMAVDPEHFFGVLARSFNAASTVMEQCLQQQRACQQRLIRQLTTVKSS